ncbi:MarR family transcriptional regulator [Neotabrizicola shimadae]|uniref:MarR family transcriptional regulator n=2 Tax=Neotabrizicola shimadae TaxID=2807096 RepID=A0A8G1EAG0_9RHOB|nr:MarR family transcriptional regulator [Neotabrizicola shimadae]
MTSDLTDHLGYWLRLVSNAVSNGFARRLQAKDVTVAEWVLLRLLLAGKGQPSALAREMGMTKGAISKLSDRLEARGLVARQSDPQDGRAQVLRLTEAGAALVPLLAAMADTNDTEFFAVLSEDERATLRALIEKMAERHGLTETPVD